MKPYLAFFCSLSLAVTAVANGNKSRTENILNTIDTLAQVASVVRSNQENKSDRLRRISQRLAQEIDLKANRMNDRDLTDVTELLKRAGEIVKDASDNTIPSLVDADTVAVSRKTGGEWVTLGYDQAVEVSQLNLRGIGNGSIKIYAIHFINIAGQSIRIETGTLNLAGNTMIPVFSNVKGPVTHVQILAEAFRSAMSLTVESYSSSQGNLGPWPPVIHPPGPGPIRPPDSQGRLTCVSRDNNGANPWMMSVREGVTDTKIPGTVYTNKQSCENAISSIQYKSGLSMLCATRDNDGSNPYVLGILDLRARSFNAIKKDLVFSDVASCLKGLADVSELRDGLKLCASRDRDGNNPYSMYFIDRNHNIQKSTEQYRDYETCRNNL